MGASQCYKFLGKLICCSSSGQIEREHLIIILIIEDNEDIQANLIDFLLAENYQVLAATDGLTGLKLAKAYQPDLILCNLSLADLDGLTMLSLLQQSKAKIPFVMMTTGVDQTTAYLCHVMGCYSCITKPFTINKLLETIAAALNSK